MYPAGTPKTSSLSEGTPAEYAPDAHHWLILHGRYVCKARKPECWRCSVIDLCDHRPKTPAPPDLTPPLA